MQYSQARQCATSLRISEEDEPLCKSTSIISSAITLIVQSAQFVEEKAREDPNLGNLSLAVFAKTKGGPNSTVKEFRLWGPRLPPPTSSIIVPENDCPPDPESESSKFDESGKLPQDVAAAENDENDDDSIVTDAEARPEAQIEDQVVAQSLSLLLDASGITSHPSCNHHRTLGSVPAAVLRNAVRSIMEMYKNKNRLVGKDVKYSSLLPKELRHREIRLSSLVLLRSTKGFLISSSDMKAVLTVKKPDRNKKELHFAMLAALMQFDPQGICKQVLESLARKGLGASGCTLKPGMHCGGPNSCIERRSRLLCKFFDSTNEQVGFGEVYRTVSFLKGCCIPSEKMMVRFTSGGNAGSSSPADGFVPWDTDFISRRKLLDAFGNIVGSAISVQQVLQSEAESSSACGNDVDISEAVVVCNIRIFPDRYADAYHFSEWHRFAPSCVREINKAVFPKKSSLKTLKNFEDHLIGFWHKKYIQDGG